MGYDKINLHGASYGTKTVQVYTMMFPKHARAVVAYHSNALHLPLYPTILSTAQAALDHTFTYCEQDKQCHTAYPDTRGEWQIVLKRIASGPVATSYILPGQNKPYELNKEGLEYLVFQLLWAGDYRKVPNAIHFLATHED